MLQKLGRIFLAAMAVAPGTWAAAETCDVEQALTALETDVVGTLTQQQRSAARRILTNLCDTTTIQSSAVQARETDKASDNAEDDAKDDAEASKGLFGIEFRRADEDSKAHDRLRKR